MVLPGEGPPDRGLQQDTSKVDAPSVVVVHTASGHPQDGVASLMIPREVAAKMKGNKYSSDTS